MLALVVFLFVLSWLPLYAVFAIMKFGKQPQSAINILENKI